MNIQPTRVDSSHHRHNDAFSTIPAKPKDARISGRAADDGLAFELAPDGVASLHHLRTQKIRIEAKGFCLPGVTRFAEPSGSGST